MLFLSTFATATTTISFFRGVVSTPVVSKHVNASAVLFFTVTRWYASESNSNKCNHHHASFPVAPAMQIFIVNDPLSVIVRMILNCIPSN